MLRSYEANYDAEMKGLDAHLKASAAKVKSSKGLDRYTKFVWYLKDSSYKSANMIKFYQKEILHAEGGEARTAKVNFLDNALLQEYLDNSSATHELCINELHYFIKSASRMASCIEQNRLDQIENARTKYHEDASKVVAKVNSLLDQHRVTLNKLKTKIEKLGEKRERTRILRKALHVIFISFLSALVVCSLIAAAMAAPPVAAGITAHPGLAAFIAAGAAFQSVSPAITGAQKWILNMIKEYESNLAVQEGLVQSMVTGTRETINQLNDIRRQLDTVIETGNATGEGRQKLAKFKKEIKELDEARKNCVRVIEAARKEVLDKYKQYIEEASPEHAVKQVLVLQIGLYCHGMVYKKVLIVR